MTVAEEKDLWLAWKDRGDESAREMLIVRHMKIVKYVAGRMAIHVPTSVEMDDLVGWGVLGLLDAVEKYDHTQNIKFTTYASIRIRGAIIDQIRSLDWAPRSLRAMARKEYRPIQSGPTWRGSMRVTWKCRSGPSKTASAKIRQWRRL